MPVYFGTVHALPTAGYSIPGLQKQLSVCIVSEPNNVFHPKELAMAVCEVCSNEYDKPIEISMAGSQHTFDSFECAIHALAPVCNHCGCRIIGHGVETGHGVMYC